LDNQSGADAGTPAATAAGEARIGTPAGKDVGLLSQSRVNTENWSGSVDLTPILGKGLAETLKLGRGLLRPHDTVLRGTVVREAGVTHIFAELEGPGASLGPWHVSRKGGLDEAVDLLSHDIILSSFRREPRHPLRDLDPESFR